MRRFFALIVISTSCFTFGQSGCIDLQAQNYDPLAAENDGSCVYGVTNYSPIIISDLTDGLSENSGLLFLNNSIYSINDGGNSTIINELAQNGSVVRDIFIDSVLNIDWEAITESENELFIGDFGNNGGLRTNLKILRIDKNHVLQNDTVQSSSINYYYPDQSSFTNQLNNNNFDCEAFVYYQDSLHLFTKGWENLYTKHYVIPINSSDSVVAILRDSMFVDGLITDASIDLQTGNLLLLGYKNNGSNFYSSFVYLLFDFPGNQFFKGNKRRIEIGNMLTLSQTEGITWKDQYMGYISSEKISSSFITVQPKLFEFDFTTFFENPSTGNYFINDTDFLIYPNPTNKLLNVEIDVSKVNFKYSLIVDNFLGQTIYQSPIENSKLTFGIGNEKGLYFLRIIDLNEKTIYVHKIVLN